jgi:hypothetical protein
MLNVSDTSARVFIFKSFQSGVRQTQNSTKENTDKIAVSRGTMLLLNNYRNLIGIKRNYLALASR